MMFGRRRSNGVSISRSVHRWIREADAARDRGDWTAAAGAYGRAVTADPSLHHIWMQFGNCAGEAGDVERALDAYAHAGALRPDDIEPDLFSARLYRQIGKQGRGGPT